MKYVFAGDRALSCAILSFMMEKGYNPIALLVTEGEGSTHADELIKISSLDQSLIFKGKDQVDSEKALNFFRTLELDYIIGIHYPYIIKKELLEIPKIGFLNLHPAYLPFNKGWNTPSWAILDKTEYGATLHFMSEELDKGDIIHQKKLAVSSFDTADSLYQKALQLEVEVFKEAFQNIVSLKPNKVKQVSEGTTHKKTDLQKIRAIDLDETIVVKDFLDKLRALTTNNLNEMAYFSDGDKKIGVRIEFVDL